MFSRYPRWCLTCGCNGADQQGWICPAYFLTFFPTSKHGMLANHQVVAPGGGTIGGDFVAPLKATHIGADGALRLVFFPGNHALKGERLPPPPPPIDGRQVVNNLSSVPGFVSTGRVSLQAGGSLAICDCVTNDRNSTLAMNSSLVFTIYKGKELMETVDRKLTASLLGSTDDGSTEWILIQRHGMVSCFARLSVHTVVSMLPSSQRRPALCTRSGNST
eukprot:COSAG01_NODE_1751_length_9323_cov_5.197507_2_plen_219_part_00